MLEMYIKHSVINNLLFIWINLPLKKTVYDAVCQYLCIVNIVTFSVFSKKLSR